MLDDCQWADELTYRLIRRWQTASDESPGPRHALLLAAFRSEDVGNDHPLRSISDTSHLQLSPFAPQEIGQLLESMAGPLPVEVVNAIIRLADGSPFMASAVLRGLAESGTLLRAGWLACRRAQDRRNSILQPGSDILSAAIGNLARQYAATVVARRRVG